MRAGKHVSRGCTCDVTAGGSRTRGRCALSSARTAAALACALGVGAAPKLAPPGPMVTREAPSSFVTVGVPRRGSSSSLSSEASLSNLL